MPRTPLPSGKPSALPNFYPAFKLAEQENTRSPCNSASANFHTRKGIGFHHQDGMRREKKWDGIFSRQWGGGS